MKNMQPESHFKQIPSILIHLNPNISLQDELDSLNSAGVIPYRVIISDKLRDASQIPGQIRTVFIAENKVSHQIYEELTNLKNSAIHFDQVLVYQDDTLATSQDILQGLYNASQEPEAFHIIEMEEVLRNKPFFVLMITERIFGAQLDEPNPFLWIIPIKALDFFTRSGRKPRFFPLSWLGACHQESIPIRVSFLGTGSSPKLIHPFGPMRLLFYSFGLFFRYTLSSLTSVIADNSMFLLLTTFGVSYWLALVLSRIFSIVINYSLLRTMVFRERGNDYKSFLKYVALVIFSTSIVWMGLKITREIFPIHIVLLKIMIEMIMFFFNYFISKTIVFRAREKQRGSK